MCYDDFVMEFKKPAVLEAEEGGKNVAFQITCKLPGTLIQGIHVTFITECAKLHQLSATTQQLSKGMF